MTDLMKKQSIFFKNPPYVQGHASIVGKKEGNGPLGNMFDIREEDDLFGKDNWEEAESEMQKRVFLRAVEKSKLKKDDIDFVFAGDLLGQSIASTFGLMDYNIAMFGLYGACSTSAQAIILSSIAVAGGFAQNVMALTSSHFASAEKQFRFPLEYGNQRPISASWTVTGAGAFVVGKEKKKIKIPTVTVGKIVDYGIKDSMNMGAAMAPAACDTILHNLKESSCTADYYDRIITGDLGIIGQEILIKMLKDKGYDISKNHIDCGIEMFNDTNQDTHAGGSGCGCGASVLSAKILPNIENGKWKRVLYVATGALLSTVSFNEGKSVPAIAHGVVFEK